VAGNDDAFYSADWQVKDWQVKDWQVKGKPERQKNAGLKVVTLIATLNPVSQVLW
jgi:hypothetical protein